MAKPMEEWSIDELRMEAVRVADELARRAAVPAAGAGKKPRVDVVRACENWVRGVAWDETFTLEMVEDELALHERKAGQELGPLERDRLTQRGARAPQRALSRRRLARAQARASFDLPLGAFAQRDRAAPFEP